MLIISNLIHNLLLSESNFTPLKTNHLWNNPVKYSTQLQKRLFLKPVL